MHINYYIEGERVCSKIGGGFGPAPYYPINNPISFLNGGYEDVQQDLYNMVSRSIECTQYGGSFYISDNLDPVHNEDNNFEDLQYFYHPDHLGSSSFITDATGYAVQHLQYLPFGETFVDQQKGYDSRYTFSAKEKDDETQYSYFGARYYDSDLSVWLSVDPLSDKYPNLSPYAYCAGNPVILKDPNGEDIVYFDWNGNEVNRIESKTEFKTYIQCTEEQKPFDDSKGWKEVPMPKIIQNKPGQDYSTSTSAYQKYDYIIAARVGLFNQTKNNGLLTLYSLGGEELSQDIIKTIPDLDPTLIKAMTILESDAGVNGKADIISANNKGDFQDYKTFYGLTEKRKLNISASIYFGIRFLASKGIGYEDGFYFKGWERAAGNYNGFGYEKEKGLPHNTPSCYEKFVIEMVKNSTAAKPENY